MESTYQFAVARVNDKIDSRSLITKDPLDTRTPRSAVPFHCGPARHVQRFSNDADVRTIDAPVRSGSFRRRRVTGIDTAVVGSRRAELGIAFLQG
jgi:hypothetical protein